MTTRDYEIEAVSLDEAIGKITDRLWLPESTMSARWLREPTDGAECTAVVMVPEDLLCATCDAVCEEDQCHPCTVEGIAEILMETAAAGCFDD